MATPRLDVELMSGMAVGAVGTSGGSLSAAGGRLVSALAAHATGALTFAKSAKPGFTLALLLAGPAFGFLSLGTMQVASIAAIALVFRCARFLQCDGDRLAAALDPAAFASGAAFQFAMLELMHDAAGDALLPGRFCHLDFTLRQRILGKPGKWQLVPRNEAAGGRVRAES
jgi:hypothetical protein